MQKNNNQSINNNKYVPPSKKHLPQSNTSSQSNTSLNLTKKKEPKKEFLLKPNDDSAFPTLNSLTSSTNLKPLLSFANATKKEVIQETADFVSDVEPGWIHIRKNNNTGKIEYKYGKSTVRYPCSNDNFEQRLSRIIFNNRLAIEQYERDSDIIRLGDLSEYYGEKTIYEMFEEEERLLNNQNDSDNSSSSETEYETYLDTYENNKFEINGQ